MAQKASYAVRLGPLGPDHLRVQSIRGVEAISSLYRFDVSLVASVPRELFERAILTQRAALGMEVGDRRRVVHGIATRVRAEGQRQVAGQDVWQYRVRIEPTASLLRWVHGSRIFRGMSVADVLGQVVGTARIDARFELEGRHPTCDYLTQFQETDLAFLRRIAAENGILFYWKHPDEIDAALASALDALAGAAALAPLSAAVELGVPAIDDAAGARHLVPGEAIVFTDRATYLPLAGVTGSNAIPHRSAGSLGDGAAESVTAFEVDRSVRPSAAAYRDYDPSRPRTMLEAAMSLAAAGRVVGESEGAPIEPATLEVYAHGGRNTSAEFADVGDEPARMLRQARRRARVARGSVTSARFEAGRRFALEEHPESSGEYAITVVRHEGSAASRDGGAPARHLCTFECVPATVPYVPKPPAKRAVQACVTATVVGPPGQDVYTNERGEVKVRFHWDRRPGGADDASAWIRTMQPWAGAGWGAQFIPRVGTEVVIAFEAGDPDRPIVLGGLHNGVNPTAFALPRDGTRSGFRTRTTPEGDGFNELSFEDAKDREQIYLRAQRDFDSLVERDRTARIKSEDRTIVDGDRSVEVGGEMRSLAKARRSAEVVADDALHVRGTRSVSVDGDLQEHVGRERSVRVEKDDRREVMGESVLVAHADLTASVRGSAAILVGREDAKRSVVSRVEGTTSISGSEIIDVSSDKEVLLRCGSSSIRLTSGGIEIAAAKVTVRGKDARLLLEDGEAKLKTKSAFQVVSDDKIALVASGASVGLASEAKIDGSQVLLNSPNSASDTIETDDPSPTTIELVDQDGNPIPNQRFRLVLDDGSEHTGFVDDDGKAEVFVTANGHIVWPDLADADQG